MFSFWGSQSSKNAKSYNGHRKTKKKRMNCSPVVAGKTVTTETCMTGDILQKIKSEYNHTHRDNPIRETDPKAVLAELRKRLSQCSDEDCWLRQIKDTALRKKLEKYIFAPKHPREWKYNPNEWLSNYDIFNVLTQWENAYPEFEFIGPTFIDFDAPREGTNGQCVERELCRFSLEDQIRAGRKKVAIVFNLDKHTQSGSHWVSLWVDIEDKFIFYFDSAGAKIPPEIARLVARIREQGARLKRRRPIRFRFYENHPMEHQYGNTECGMYSLFFIITMLSGKTDDHRFKNWHEKVKFFRKTRIPDKYAENLRWRYFNT